MLVFLIIIAVIVLLAVVVYVLTSYLLGLAIKREGSLDMLAGNQNVMGKGWENFQSKTEEGNKWYDETPYENVTIKSFDGLRLAGRFYAEPHDCGAEPSGTVIMAHGYRSSCRKNMSYAGKILYEAGYHILTIDQRCHGDSEGKYICMGQLEGRDVADWAWKAAEMDRERGEGELPILLYGISMGATSVMMACGQKLPAQVRCMVSDCGFCDVGDIVKPMIKRALHLPEKPVYFLANLVFRMKTGCDFNASTEDILKKSELPVLFIHGEKDTFVRPYMSEKNYQASAAPPEKKQLYIVKGAAHGQAIYVDTEGVVSTLMKFLKDNM